MRRRWSLRRALGAMKGHYPNWKRVLDALAREGGSASAYTLGRALSLGPRVNGTLNRLKAEGRVRRTDRKEGRSVVWELPDDPG
jgi:hypothetical protein